MDLLMNFFNPYMELTTSNYSLWKVSAAYRKSADFVPPLLKLKNTWAISDKDKADTFADHLENNFMPNYVDFDITPTLQINPTTKIKYFSPSEIRKVTDHLKTRKAPGLDEITGQLIKELPKKEYVLLTYLFNAIMKLQYMPTGWKIAKIIILLKSGKQPDQPQLYKPISLLSIFSELFEKLFLTQIMEIIDDKNILPTHQFEFSGKTLDS